MANVFEYNPEEWELIEPETSGGVFLYDPAEWEEYGKETAPISEEAPAPPKKYGFFDKLKEMADEPSDVLDLIPFVAGAKEVSEIAQVAASAYKLDQGTADQKDQDRLVEFLEEANKDTTFGYKVLDVVAQMPSFMGEFLLTSGIYAVGRKAGAKTATAAVKKYLGKSGEKLLEKKLGKIGVKIVGGVAGSTIQAPIMGLPRIVSGTIERSMPNLRLSEDERGELSAMIAGEGEDLMPALLKSFGDQWAETVSEHSGGLFAELGGIAKNAAVKSGLLSAFLKANPTKSPGKSIKLFKKMGYHGVLNEMAEERLGEVLRAGIGVTEEYNLPTAEQLAIELVSFSVPGVAQAIYSHTLSEDEDVPGPPDSAARDTLLDESEEEGMTAKEILTGEKEAREPMATGDEQIDETLAAEEAVAEFDDETLEQLSETPEEAKPEKPKTKKTPSFDSLEDDDVLKRISNIEKSQVAGRMTEKQSENLDLLKQELADRGIEPAAETAPAPEKPALKPEALPDVEKEGPGDSIDALIAKYKETGRIATRYPRKKTISLGGGRAIPEKEAIAKMRGVVGKPVLTKPGAKESKVRTLRGRIKEMGGINFINYTGELRDLPTAVKYLSKKTGVSIDNAVNQLISDGWLDKGTTVASFLEDLRTNAEILKRDRVTRDMAEKAEHELSPQEKRLKKEVAREPEAPPEGKYVQMRAQDLPEGAELTIIEGKSREGWDRYKVTSKDPFSITLTDGEEIELKPLDEVEVLQDERARRGEKPAGILETVPERIDTEDRGEGIPEAEVSPAKKSAEIDAAAAEAATSPESDLPEPTDAQKEAGNYKKGHVSIQGMDITIENPKGSERSGTDKSGKKWSAIMQNHYGYFKRSEGKDGDQIDVFIGNHPESDKAYIVDQVDPGTQKFDEHKTLLGFNSEDEAKKAYLANYEKGWKGLKNITEVPIDEFKQWIGDGKRKKEPFSKEAKPDEGKTEGRLARPEREGEEPGRPIQERETGGREAEGGRVLQEERPDEAEVKPGKAYYYKEFEVEETGETVRLKIDAVEALGKIEDDIFYLKALRDCIA